MIAKAKPMLTQRGPDKPFRTAMQMQALRRVADLTRIYRDQYPNGLPHNGIGVKYARYMCRTLAFFEPIDRREKWLDRYASWMDGATRVKLVGMSCHWYSKKSLGHHLELYDEDRERLKAWTIEATDVDEDKREAINKEKHRKTLERARRKKGIKSHDQSISRQKPWEKAGYKCRRTWERHRKRAMSQISENPQEGVSQKRDDPLYYKNVRSLICDTSTEITRNPAPQAQTVSSVETGPVHWTPEYKEAA
jgi:hypothetical protein